MVTPDLQTIFERNVTMSHDQRLKTKTYLKSLTNTQFSNYTANWSIPAKTSATALRAER